MKKIITLSAVATSLVFGGMALAAPKPAPQCPSAAYIHSMSGAQPIAVSNTGGRAYIFLLSNNNIILVDSETQISVKEAKARLNAVTGSYTVNAKTAQTPKGSYYFCAYQPGQNTDMHFSGPDFPKQNFVVLTFEGVVSSI